MVKAHSDWHEILVLLQETKLNVCALKCKVQTRSNERHTHLYQYHQLQPELQPSAAANCCLLINIHTTTTWLRG
jgi:hypothetical protein